MNKLEESRAILLNLSDINRKLIMNKQNSKTWDAYQEYFGEVLNLGILRIEDAISFALSLYSSRIIPFTTIEEQEIKTKKDGIKNFMKKISDSDYIKEQSISSENMGTLYEQELAKATAPEVIENNTSYSKHSNNR